MRVGSAHTRDTVSSVGEYLNTLLCCSRNALSLGAFGGRGTLLPTRASLVAPFCCRKALRATA
jgi:hypothetical protein